MRFFYRNLAFLFFDRTQDERARAEVISKSKHYSECSMKYSRVMLEEHLTLVLTKGRKIICLIMRRRLPCKADKKLRSLDNYQSLTKDLIFTNISSFTRWQMSSSFVVCRNPLISYWIFDYVMLMHINHKIARTPTTTSTCLKGFKNHHPTQS